MADLLSHSLGPIRECGPVRCAKDVTPINRQVNDPKNDDAKLIQPEAAY